MFSFKNFIPKKALILALVDRDQEILELKAKLEIQHFKYIEKETIEYFQSIDYLAPDIKIKGIHVMSQTINIKESKVAFVVGKFSGKKMNTSPELLFVLHDLKSNNQFTASLNEAKILQRELK